jgi:hypothetical protein
MSRITLTETTQFWDMILVWQNWDTSTYICICMLHWWLSSKLKFMCFSKHFNLLPIPFKTLVHGLLSTQVLSGYLYFKLILYYILLLVFRILWLLFNVYLQVWVLGISHISSWRFSNFVENTAVSFFRVYVCTGVRKPLSGSGRWVGGNWHDWAIKVLFYGKLTWLGNQGAILWGTIKQFRKKR